MALRSREIIDWLNSDTDGLVTVMIKRATPSTDGVRLATKEFDPASAPALKVVLAPACPGDANGDRLINFADITAVLTSFGTSGDPFRVGDANGDGTVSFTDITSVLTAFGIPCVEGE